MAAQKPEPAKSMVFVESSGAQDVFASWAHGFSQREGNIHITFSVSRFNHTDKQERQVVIGNLVMPIKGAQGLAMGLYNFLKEIGADPAAKPPDTPVQ